jgi:microcystin-dependent protein
MADPFLGELKLVPYNFAPRGWAFCQGQILPIAQNTALFALLGTMYGGNGQTTFALPDLRGRVVVHPGQGPGLSNYDQGEVAGVEAVTLTNSQIPAWQAEIMRQCRRERWAMFMEQQLEGLWHRTRSQPPAVDSLTTIVSRISL